MFIHFDEEQENRFCTILDYLMSAKIFNCFLQKCQFFRSALKDSRVAFESENCKNCSAYTHNSCVFHEMVHNNILFNKSKEIGKEYDGICTTK